MPAIDVSTHIMMALQIGSIVAVPVTAGLLWLFNRAVVRGMRLSGPSGASSKGSPTTTDRAAASVKPHEPGGTNAEAEGSVTRVLAVYALAGGAFAITMTAFMFGSYGYGANYLSFAYSASMYAVPWVFALFAVMPKSRLRWAYLGIYAGLTALLLAWTVIRNPDILGGILQVWITSAAVALLLVAFTLRRLRAAGPLVLAIVVGAFAGGRIAGELALGSTAIFSASLNLWASLSLPFATFVAAYSPVFGVLGGLIGIAAGWALLVVIGRRYRRKRFSDQVLFLDTVFAWFAVTYAAQLAVEGPRWLLAAPAAFLAYKVLAMIGLALVRRKSPPGRRDLLLLRPFSLGRRSERLFDSLSKVWLRGGAIHMIAGPDLAVSTVAPTDFLAFLSGRMKSRFIRDEAELAEHLDGLDINPDPDGRYRLNQLYCGDDVWQLAMRALAARSDVILMDLRGLTAANQGCLYEIGVLIRGVSLRRVHFAVDATTDRTFLDAAVASLWEQLPADSPNRPYGGIASRIVWVEDKPKSRQQLLEALMQPLEAAPSTVG